MSKDTLILNCTQLQLLLKLSVRSNKVKEEVISICIFLPDEISQITRPGNWYTREEMGNSYRNMTVGELVFLRPPIQTMYAKMPCANQTGMLSGVYNQVSCLPCFCGPRI